MTRTLLFLALVLVLAPAVFAAVRPGVGRSQHHKINGAETVGCSAPWGLCGLCQTALTGLFEGGGAICANYGIVSKFCQEAAPVCEAAFAAMCQQIEQDHCDPGLAATEICYQWGACCNPPNTNPCSGQKALPPTKA